MRTESSFFRDICCLPLELTLFLVATPIISSRTPITSGHESRYFPRVGLHHIRYQVISRSDSSYFPPRRAHQVKRIPLMMATMAAPAPRDGISVKIRIARRVANTGSQRISVDKSVAEMNFTA